MLLEILSREAGSGSTGRHVGFVEERVQKEGMESLSPRLCVRINPG